MDFSLQKTIPIVSFNPVKLRNAEISNFGLPECNRVKMDLDFHDCLGRENFHLITKETC